MLYGLVLLPLVGALIAWFIPDNRQRPLVLPFLRRLAPGYGPGASGISRPSAFARRVDSVWTPSARLSCWLAAYSS